MEKVFRSGNQGRGDGFERIGGREAKAPSPGNAGHSQVDQPEHYNQCQVKVTQSKRGVLYVQRQERHQESNLYP